MKILLRPTNWKFKSKVKGNKLRQLYCVINNYERLSYFDANSNYSSETEQRSLYHCKTVRLSLKEEILEDDFWLLSCEFTQDKEVRRSCWNLKSSKG